MTTEKRTIVNDKHVFYVQASSFPEGVKASYDKLGQITGNDTFGEVFGISNMGSDGKIVYRAAAPETFEGEAAKKGCPTFKIRKGTYLCHTIKDWEQHMDQFQIVFNELLKHPQLDPDGYCLEWYKGVNEVICMVRLAE